MPGSTTSAIHISNVCGLVGFVVLWLSLVASIKMMLHALRNRHLIGWAVGPLGISTLFLAEPSLRFLLLSALFPAFVSGGILYLGLFSNLPSPLTFPHNALLTIVVLVLGILLTSLGDWISMLRDLRYPLWGEARILRNIQYLRSSCATIHFTAFGH